MLRHDELVLLVEHHLHLVLSVKVHIDLLTTHRIGIVLCLTEGTQGIRRTAETTDILFSLFRPAQGIRQFVAHTQRVGIEIALTVEGDTTEDTVEETVLYDIRIFTVACCLEHTPVEEHITDIGTGLVVGCRLWQLIRTAITLVYLLDIRRFIVGSIG